MAIKRIPHVFQNSTDARRILREIFILRHTQHPNVIKLLDIPKPASYQSFRDLYIVFEFVDTDLYKLILSYACPPRHMVCFACEGAANPCSAA